MNYQFHSLLSPFFFSSLYNRIIIIRSRFCDIQNNQGLKVLFGNVVKDDKQRLVMELNSMVAALSSKFVRMFFIVLSFRLGH